jgi:hypothetical protein
MGLRWDYQAVLRASNARLKQLFQASAILLLSVAIVASATAQSLRVVAYNIDADTGGADGSMGGSQAGPGLTDVLQAIGRATLAGNAQPIDVLALEELNATKTVPSTGTPSKTLDFIVTQLNNIYGAGTYKADTVLDATTGGTGGGPSGLIYNTHTVQDLGAAVIGSASGSGAPRAPIRYKLAPLGYNDHSADFFLYVSHMKSGTDSSPGGDLDRRNVEANTIRTNSASAAVGANAHVIYAGDFNVNDSSEAAYQTMISGTLSGVGTVGQAVDVLNPNNNWNTSGTTSSPYQGLFSETATSIRYRDDFQFVTNPMLNQPGMQLVPNSLTTFGNGGGIFHQSVTNSANSAALVDLGQSPYTPAYRSSVVTALTTATDHLPIVADYSYATAVGAPGDFDHSGVVNAADYNLWRSTFGSTTNLAADGNHNGVVDEADYVIWRSASPAGSGSSLDSTAQVPEPFSAVLMIGGVFAISLSHRCRRRN